MKVQDYEDKLTELTFALTNSRRDLIQKSLDYVADFFADINRQLTQDNFELDTKLLKMLVVVSRHALIRISPCLGAKEVDVRLFLRLKKEMQEYLTLIIMHIAKAGVTPDDIARRHRRTQDIVLIRD